MGINLCQDEDFFIQNNLPHATSLLAFDGQRRTAQEAAVLLLEELEPILEPVSYTHLDVYKRQTSIGSVFPSRSTSTVRMTLFPPVPGREMITVAFVMGRACRAVKSCATI